MTWSDERVELLKKLLADGLPASQIAGELGGVTRNGVIGKVHRLGLPLGGNTARRKTNGIAAAAARRVDARRRRAAAGAVPKFVTKLMDIREEAPPEPPVENVDDIIPVGQRKTLLELEGTHCRFPFGDPRTSSFFFCGGAKPDMQSIPYCPHHMAASRGGG